MLRALTCAAAMALLAGSAHARLFFQFNDVNGLPISNLTIGGPGQQGAFRVYLAEDDASSFLQDEGLAGFGVRLDYDSSLAAIASASDVTPNPVFDAPSLVNIAAGEVEVNGFSFVNAPAMPDAAGRVFLAEFTLTAGSPGSSLVVTSDPHPAPFTDTLTGDSTALDQLIANASIVVTVLPEPNTLALLMLGALAWRRR